MYQLKISVSEKNSGWLSAVERLLASKIPTIGGIMTKYAEHGRISLAAACESRVKCKLTDAVQSSISEAFATIVKMRYIDSKLRLPMLKRREYKLLLHTLVAFDRESERELLKRIFKVSGEMNLDGYFNFRCGELKKRWNEICKLTTDNAMFLSDDMTLYELIRFLVSAINPKIASLELDSDSGEYCLSGSLEEGTFYLKTPDSEQLMLYLIDLAPLELTVKGALSDTKLETQLTEIFDAHSVGQAATRV